MSDDTRKRTPATGLFGLGWQGYVIAAIILLGSTAFAITRDTWISMLLSALLLPLIMFGILALVSRLWRQRPSGQWHNANPGQGMDILTFLARTNPIRLGSSTMPRQRSVFWPGQRRSTIGTFTCSATAKVG